MTDPAPYAPRPQGIDGPTCDIRRPSAPGERVPSPPSAPSSAPAYPPGAPTRAQRLAEQPTGELGPSGGLPRDKTLQFGHGPGAPAGPVAVPPAPSRAARSRRWPWVFLALLPLVIIIGSGIWLFVLLSHP